MSLSSNDVLPRSTEPVDELTPGPAIPGTTGHVVIEAGCSEDQRHAVAVWHLDPSGNPVGAWVTVLDEVHDNPAAAARLYTLLACRSLLCWTLDEAHELRDKLTKWTGRVLPAGWEASTVCFPDALAEIAQQRRLHAEAVEAYQKTTTSKIEPLAWRTDVPTDASSLQDLQTAARMARPVAPSEVAERALLVARLTRWTVGLWRDTEVVRRRRKYLRQAFGPEAPLPPRWIGQLQAAHKIGW